MNGAFTYSIKGDEFKLIQNKPTIHFPFFVHIKIRNNMRERHECSEVKHMALFLHHKHLSICFIHSFHQPTFPFPWFLFILCVLLTLKWMERSEKKAKRTENKPWITEFGSFSIEFNPKNERRKATRILFLFLFYPLMTSDRRKKIINYLSSGSFSLSLFFSIQFIRSFITHSIRSVRHSSFNWIQRKIRLTMRWNRPNERSELQKI